MENYDSIVVMSKKSLWYDFKNQIRKIYYKCNIFIELFYDLILYLQKDRKWKN